VTFVTPSEAAAVIDTGTVRLVAVAAMGAPAVTPALAKVTAEELLKCVKVPVIVTGMLVAPCGPVLGFTCVTTGVPAVTAKPLFKTTVSSPVVNVILREPTTAAGSILIVTVAVVGLFTANDARAMPAPKLAVVVPWAKCVNWPVIVTERLACPCCPVFGFALKIVGTPP
jgi:hypothetical protein